jgi:hypothetical protein
MGFNVISRHFSICDYGKKDVHYVVGESPTIDRVSVRHFPGHLTGFCQINDTPMHRGQSKDFLKTQQPMGQISGVKDVGDAIDQTRRNGVHAKRV